MSPAKACIVGKNGIRKEQPSTSKRSVTTVQVYLNAAGSLKLGCLAQAMMITPKDSAATPGNGEGGMDGHVDGEIDMEIEV